MQAKKPYAYIVIAASLLAISVFNIASQAWDTFWLTAFEWRIGGLFSVLSAWGIPMFIAGIGLNYLSDELALSNRIVYTKMLPRALISCVFWWVLSALIYLKYNHSGELDTDTFFESMSKVLDTPFNIRLLHLTVSFFAFYPLLKRIADSEKLTKYLVVAFFLFSFVLPAIRMIPYVNIITLFTDQINWGFFTSFGLYLFLGVFVSRIEFRWHHRIVIYCIGALATVAMLACTAFFSSDNIGFDSRFVNEQSPLVALQVMAALVLCKTALTKWGQSMRMVIIKRVSIAAYAFLPLFSITQNLVGYFASMEKMPLIGLIPVSAIMCFSFSIGLSVLIKKTPILSYLS